MHARPRFRAITTGPSTPIATSRYVMFTSTSNRATHRALRPSRSITATDVRQLIGYDVEYRYRGEVYMSRLDYDPGERLRVRISVTPARP